MKQCPQCALRFPDEHQFCPQDGSDLVPFVPVKSATPNSATPVREPSVVARAETPVAPAKPVDTKRVFAVFGLATVLLIGGSFAFSAFMNAPAASSGAATETVVGDDIEPEGAQAPDEQVIASPDEENEDNQPDEVAISAPVAVPAVRFSDCSATASSFLKSMNGNRYDPSVVLDGLTSTAWNTHNKRHGVGEWIQIEWPTERTVTRIGMIVGYDKRSSVAKYQDDPWMWNRNHRVRAATLLFSGGEQTQVTFDDVTPLQYRDIAPVSARWVRVTIDDVYLNKQGGTDPDWDDIAVGEIQVWGNP